MGPAGDEGWKLRRKAEGERLLLGIAGLAGWARWPAESWAVVGFTSALSVCLAVITKHHGPGGETGA